MIATLMCYNTTFDTETQRIHLHIKVDDTNPFNFTLRSELAITTVDQMFFINPSGVLLTLGCHGTILLKC